MSGKGVIPMRMTKEEIRNRIMVFMDGKGTVKIRRKGVFNEYHRKIGIKRTNMRRYT